MADEKTRTTLGQHLATKNNPGGKATPMSLAEREDIWPRPPRDLTGFQDLSVASWDFPPGFPGLIVDTGIKDQISLVPETDIPFAAAVADGSQNGYCKLATGGDDHIVGIAVYDWTSGLVDQASGTLSGYKAHSWACGILRVGRIWAKPSTAVHRGDLVGFGASGQLQAGGTEIEGANWATDAAANQLAVVQINLSAGKSHPAVEGETAAARH